MVCLRFPFNIYWFCREGARVSWGYINRILGQPSLIRESSMSKFPWSALASRGRQNLFNNAIVAGPAKGSTVRSGFENVVLHPSLQRRIEQLARATANTKSHQAPFRNMLFYGPPGTGKTLVAREIARKSVSLVSYIQRKFICPNSYMPIPFVYVMLCTYRIF